MLVGDVLGDGEGGGEDEVGGIPARRELVRSGRKSAVTCPAPTCHTGYMSG